MRLKDYLFEIEQHFELIKMIGYGGMGLCYLGRDLQNQKLYALKILHPDWQEHKMAQQQFHWEAQIETHFQAQKHIVHTYEMREFKNLNVKIMEFMQGMTLKQYLASTRKVNHQLAQQVYDNISKALKIIHAQGIIHRDIKPANIFLEVNGNIKLFDFGIAQINQNKDYLFDEHCLRELTRTLFKITATQLKEKMLNFT